MRNLILFTLMLVSGFMSAQTFNFSCELTPNSAPEVDFSEVPSTIPASLDPSEITIRFSDSDNLSSELSYSLHYYYKLSDGSTYSVPTTSAGALGNSYSLGSAFNWLDFESLDDQGRVFESVVFTATVSDGTDSDEETIEIFFEYPDTYSLGSIDITYQGTNYGGLEYTTTDVNGNDVIFVVYSDEDKVRGEADIDDITLVVIGGLRYGLDETVWKLTDVATASEWIENTMEIINNYLISINSPPIVIITPTLSGDNTEDNPFSAGDTFTITLDVINEPSNEVVTYSIGESDWFTLDNEVSTSDETVTLNITVKGDGFESTNETLVSQSLRILMDDGIQDPVTNYLVSGIWISE